MNKKRILLIATGGTIACKKSENGLTPQMDGKELLQYVKEVEQYSIVDTITNIDVRNSNNDQMLTFRNGNKEVPQSQKRKEINKFPQDYVYNNIEEDKDEATKILCYLTIPRIVCRNGILQLMLVSPLLRNQPLIQRENYQLSFINVETLQTLEKINVNLLTACFQKTGTSFGIQFINKSTFTKNTYSIFTRYPEECKRLVEGLNYLLRYQ